MENPSGMIHIDMGYFMKNIDKNELYLKKGIIFELTFIYIVYIEGLEDRGYEKMKKVLLIMMCLGVAITSMVGCNKYNKNSNKDEGNATQIEEPVEDNNVNIDIRDTAIQVNSSQVESGELEGEKVFAVGVVSSIDSLGENMDKANFIITQNEGEKSKSYLVTWELGKLNFKSLKISDGDIVRIYGVLEGENEKGIPIIKTALIDLAM